VINVDADMIAVSQPGRPVRGRLLTTRRFPLLNYAIRRVLAGVITLIVATFLIFACIQLLPGNVAQVVLGRNATPARLAQVDAQLHLDDNVAVRYFHYLGGFLSGHFGDSTAALVQQTHVSVSSVVGPALANSLILALIVLVLFVPCSLLLGYASGRRPGGKVDHFISTTTLAVGALPEFLVGIVLIYLLFTWLGWFPPISTLNPGQSPLSDLKGLVLPVLTLLLVSMAFGARLLRASIIEVMNKEYIAVARLNGIEHRRIVLRYLLPNAVSPSIQILAQQTQYLLGGIVVVESVFNYPGIGRALVQAVSARDIQEIMIIATILAVAYIAINIIADIACALFDPRVRTSL
jgi:peptide/nickel transport system permease protein